MNFESILFRNESIDESYVCHFSPGIGRLSRVWAFCGNPQEVSIFASCLDQLFRRGNEHHKYIQVSLSDDSGTEWSLIDDNKKLQVQKGNEYAKEVSHFSQSLLEIWSSGSQLAPLQKNNEILGFYKLQEYKNSLCTMGESEHKAKDFIQTYADKKTKIIIEELNNFFQAQTPLSSENLLSFFELIVPIIYEYNSLEKSHINQEDSNDEENHKQITQSEIKEVSQLSKEISLILEIEKKYESIDYFIDIIGSRSEYLQLEEQIAKKIDQLKIEDFSEIKENLDWEQPVNLLCKIEILQRILKTSDQIGKKNLERTQESFEDYLDLAKNMISTNSSIIFEIQRLIQEINKKEDIKLVRVWKKFKLMIKKKLNEIRGAFGVTHAYKIEDDNDPTVEILNKMQKIITLFSQKEKSIESEKLKVAESFDRTTQTFETIHEQITQLKSKWITLAKECDFPIEMNLRSFNHFIQEYQSLIFLKKQREYKQLIRHLVDKLICDLKELVIEWSEVTSPEFDVSMKSPKMVLARAKSIIPYKKEKTRHLQLLQDTLMANHSQPSFSLFKKKRQEDLQKRVDDICSNHSIKTLSLKENNLQLLEKYFVFNSLSIMQKPDELTSIGQGEEVFFHERTIHGISIWKIENMSEKTYSVFSEQIEQLNTDKLHIFLFDDAEKFTKIKNKNVGRISLQKSKRIEEKKQARQQQKTEKHTENNRKKWINEKKSDAQKIVDLLNGHL